MNEAPGSWLGRLSEVKRASPRLIHDSSQNFIEVQDESRQDVLATERCGLG